MNTPTLVQFKRFSWDIAPAARAVLMAKAFAKLERERVNAYILPIFQRYAFTYGHVIAPDMAGQTIEKPEHLYLAEDEPRVKQYFEECDRAHRAHGFTGPHGHCPALIAENLLIKTENALIDVAGSLFEVDFHGLFGDDRKKLLDLVIGAALKAERSGR